VRADASTSLNRSTVGAKRSPGWRLPSRLDSYDVAAALLFVALLVLVVWTFRDYAISNDEEVQQRYGEMIIAYYTSGFVDQTLFHYRDLYLYGGLFDIVAVGVERLLPLDPYAVRHLLTALIGIGGIGAVWATAREIAGPRAGLLAAATLSVCGAWYGPMFNHTKDIPFAAAMMGATYLLVLIARQLLRPPWHLVAMFGVLCGCALGIRILGVFLGVFVVFAIAMQAPIGRDTTWREVLNFGWQSVLRLIPAVVVAYAIMIAAWPWAALEPLNPLRALTAFAEFNYPIRTILDGHVYHMGDVPRSYVPVYFAIKLTLLLLVGVVLALIFAALPQRVTQMPDVRNEGWRNESWRKENALVAFCALFPLLCQVVADGPADTGLRHFLFAVPPLAVLAGLGLDRLLDRLATISRAAVAGAAALVLLSLAFDAATLYRLHPDEYLFFNPLVGGLAGASRRYATDYWVNIMPEAVTDLEHFLDRTDTGPGRSHHYLVGVCGERLPFEKEADRRLQWTRDWTRAEFFIAPTHMNCDLALDGRVIATIKRLGVVIGVVKDRRALVRSSMADLH
jgi:hypothetical protein